ncbi:4-hydroxythreonine-4-phosphate dehydrogenase PdxA [Lignipirellula cremea]|uniref:4-hydroxythreonine-4-phosphate dehydrogenase n=1 Tax=Lignipirellula cremea TaxID=2528010 RepID=A0A518DV57_9BACT|nr:4-hydroxythreonine-4-phosphate dehydrogenase PdxA [Lignipirellula cremea]QDU95720.1 4-hydroxythreonine-4-phosphate dehydrogenase [Lignipirellula cremea]
MSSPRIAVTMGDPAGVGPEICLRMLAHEPITGSAIPIVFGSAAVLNRAASQLGLPFHAPILTRETWEQNYQAIDRPSVLDFDFPPLEQVVPGQMSPICGEAAYRYVTASIDAALAGQVEAVTTGPLNKEALYAAGHHFPGHTEIFAERMQAERSCMMLTSDLLTCSLATVHVGYLEAPRLLSIERICEVIELTAEAMRRMRGREPRLAVCGLNPHAGEHGLFGQREEERLIEPAILRMREQGYHLEGPLPADTAFLPDRRARTDAYICMYHDQGLIPLKTLAFDSAINTTLGLPVVRTSVDHGTAFDIAWQGTANPTSLLAAVRLAAVLCRPPAPLLA